MREEKPTLAIDVPVTTEHILANFITSVVETGACWPVACGCLVSRLHLSTTCVCADPQGSNSYLWELNL